MSLKTNNKSQTHGICKDHISRYRYNMIDCIVMKMSRWRNFQYCHWNFKRFSASCLFYFESILISKYCSIFNTNFEEKIKLILFVENVFILLKRCFNAKWLSLVQLKNINYYDVKFNSPFCIFASDCSETKKGFSRK